MNQHTQLRDPLIRITLGVVILLIGLVGAVSAASMTVAANAEGI